MKIFIALAVLSLSSLPVLAAEAAPANGALDKRICVRAARHSDYNARPIAQHDILASNAVGDRRPVRISTTCIHIYPDAFVAMHSAFNCLGMGDDVSARTIDGHGETCRVVKLAPFVEGSAVAPYK